MRALRHSQMHNACTVCKHVCLLLLALSYVRLRSISFCTTADTVAPRQSKKVSHAISYLEICVPAGTHSCTMPVLQTCLSFIFGYRLCSVALHFIPHNRRYGSTSAKQKVSHAQYPIWRYMRACRHSQLFKAPAIANTFASQRLRTTATPFYISPNRGDCKKNFCSALGFCVCLHIICSGEVPRGSGNY